MTVKSATTPHLISDRVVSISPDGTPHLIGGKCSSCGALNFPRADVCTKCLSEAVGEIELSSEGKLYTFSIVHQAPNGWKVPYGLGYVDLPEGIRVLAHLDAPKPELVIDQNVRLSQGVVGFDAAGVPLSTYIFIPA